MKLKALSQDELLWTTRSFFRLIIRRYAVVVDRTRSIDDLAQGHLPASTLLKEVPMQCFWQEPGYAFTCSHGSPWRVRFYLLW